MPPTTQVAVSNRFVLSSGHAVLLGLFATYAALGLFGYGTDGDTYLLLRSGHHLFVHGVYEYSRTPGYVVPEVAVGLLSLAGGHVLSNLASALLGTATLYLFRRLLRPFFPEREALLLTATVGANPFFVIAASSSMDYVYSLFFGVAAVACLPRRRYYLAALLFGLAIGSRLSNAPAVAVIYAVLLAVLLRRRETRELATVLSSGAVALLIAVVLYLPPYFASGRTLDFLTYAMPDWSLLERLYRFLYKGAYLFGLAPILLIAGVTAHRAVASRLRLPRPSLLVAGGFVVAAQALLFLNVPIEVSYLLPVLFVALPLFAFVAAPGRAGLALLLGLTLTYGFVANPDVLQRSYGEAGEVRAEVGLFVRRGVVVEDVLHREEALRTFAPMRHHPPGNRPAPPPVPPFRL